MTLTLEELWRCKCSKCDWTGLVKQYLKFPSISKEINHDSTHFLLEFIQNADDNLYDAKVEPTLNFTYHREFLRVDCNEVGFSRENINAICSIGNSTKSRDQSPDTVGEKGIGFKSVFKIADRVHIASNSYQFMFDRNEKPLGMIAPKWAPLPTDREPGYTTFILKYSPECDRPALRRELESLDPRILLFLHKLRRITVDFRDGGHSDKRQLKRLPSQQPAGMPDWKTIPLRVNLQEQIYAVMDHTVDNLPPEKKRGNAKRSQITLAFPFDIVCGIWVPKIKPQQVYAFLPIRDYGFEVLPFALPLRDVG